MIRAGSQLLILFACTVGFGAWAAALVLLQLLGRPGAGDGTSGLGWIGGPPWWVPAGLWLIANALLVWRMRPARLRVAAVPEGGAEAPPPRPSPTWRAPPAPPPPIPASLTALLNPTRLLHSASLYRGSGDGWRLRATAGADCPRLRVFLDVSILDEPDGAWRPPERLLLATVTDLAQGQELDLSVLGRSQARPGEWSWAEEGRAGAETPTLPQRPHRVRLSFAPDVHSEESLYGVLLWACADGDGRSDPILVDETAFGFKDAWEAEAPLGRVPRWRGR